MFPTKVDAWFMLLFYGGSLLLLAGAFLVWKRSKPGALIMGAVGVLFFGVSYSGQSIKYEVREDGALVFHGGLAPGGVLLNAHDVMRVEPSDDTSKAPALSFDRLKISTRGSGAVLVSPEDKAGFMDALAARDPALKRSGDTLVRAP
jgi:hypothetical protein